MKLRNGRKMNTSRHSVGNDTANSPLKHRKQKINNVESNLDKKVEDLKSLIPCKPCSNQNCDKCLRLLKGIVSSSLRASAVILVLLFVICPTLLKLCPFIYAEIVFLQRIACPPFKDLSSPAAFGLNHTRNFRVESTNSVSLGAWHLLPEDFHTSFLNSTEEFESALEQDYPVMLYLHGNLGNRGGWHRVELYKLFADMNFHVIAFDYRGFADSTGYPSEQGVVDDAEAMYNYIRKINEYVPIFVWGHSLGSAIATRFTKHLNEQNLPIDALVLESGFNNLKDAASLYPVTKIFSFLPWHDWALDGLEDYGLKFASDENIADVSVPTLILHAEDDLIVPYSLGKKLYERALEVKKEGSVEFVTIDGEHGYGHKHIHMHDDLEQIIRKFTNWYRK